MGGGVFPGSPPRLDGDASLVPVTPRRAHLASSTRVLIALVILIVALSVAAFLVWRKRIMRTFSPAASPAAAEPSPPAATTPAPPSTSHGD